MLVGSPTLVKALAAQASDVPAIVRSAETITTADLAYDLNVLAADSLRERAVGSPGLDRAARFVAAQFRRLGLRPLPTQYHGVDSAWVQRYVVPGQISLNYTASRVAMSTALTHNDRAIVTESGAAQWIRAVVELGTTARLLDTVIPPGDPVTFMAPSVLVLTGRHTPESVRRAELAGTNVLYVVPRGLDSVQRAQSVAAIRQACHGLLVLNESDSASFAATLNVAHQQPVRIVDPYLRHEAADRPWAAEVAPWALTRVLAAAEIDLTQARTGGLPAARALPSATIELDAVGKPLRDSVTAPYVVGLLPGRDSRFAVQLDSAWLAPQWLLVTAHLDTPDPHAPHGPVTVNTAGVAALLALAQALSRPEGRPRRPVVFVATSGGAQGGGASNALLSQLGFRPPNWHIELELSGRAMGDSAVVDGLREIPTKPPLDWIMSVLPDWRLQLVDGDGATPASDEATFAAMGVPSMVFRYGVGHQSQSSGSLPVDSTESARASRLTRVVAAVIRAVDEGDELPRWGAGGRRRFLQTRATAP